MHQKISRGFKGQVSALISIVIYKQAPKNIKLSIEEDLPDMARNRAVTRSLKENQDQYYNEKIDKLNKYWKNKAQRQSEVKSIYLMTLRLLVE